MGTCPHSSRHGAADATPVRKLWLVLHRPRLKWLWLPRSGPNILLVISGCSEQDLPHWGILIAARRGSGVAAYVWGFRRIRAHGHGHAGGHVPPAGDGFVSAATLLNGCRLGLTHF